MMNDSNNVNRSLGLSIGNVGITNRVHEADANYPVDMEAIKRIFLATLSRYPTEAEMNADAAPDGTAVSVAERFAVGTDQQAGFRVQVLRAAMKHGRKNCAGHAPLTRRHFLFGAARGTVERACRRAGGRLREFSRGTAKQCIFINMSGGPSHLDTWDPKDGPWNPPDAKIQQYSGGMALSKTYFPKLSDKVSDFAGAAVVRELGSGARAGSVLHSDCAFAKPGAGRGDSAHWRGGGV